MAVKQTSGVEPTVDGQTGSKSVHQQSDDVIEFEEQIDVVGCPVNGCDYTGPSFHSLYSHCNRVHHGKDGSEGIKQQKVRELFNKFEKANREYRPTITFTIGPI